MKEPWIYCKKYDKWKPKEEFAKDPKIWKECNTWNQNSVLSQCGKCEESRIIWVEEE